jgi:hypothetical protein
MAKHSPPAGFRKPDQRVYIIYDARAEYDVDEASILFSCGSLTEAKAKQMLFGSDCVIYSYELVDGIATDGKRES